VRELENIVSRAIVLGQIEEIGLELLPVPLRALAQGPAHRLPPVGGTLEDLEESALVRALEKNAWVQTRAAADLGITERNLRYKMKKFGLRRPLRGLDARGA
jgi:DNA-binding NtrC family response regulator